MQANVDGMEDDKKGEEDCSTAKEEALKSTRIPRSAFRKLKVLDLSGNLLVTLPETFGESAPVLKELYLADNKIRKLPESFGDLKKLQ